MKVLLVYKDYYPVVGGIENHVRLLARLLRSQEGIEASVLVTSPGKHTVVERDGDVPVIKAGRLFSAASTPVSPALVRELGRADADIIHLHAPYPIAESAYLLRGRRRPLVVTYHSDVVRQRLLLRLHRPVLRRVLALASSIVVTSEPYLHSSPYLAGARDRCRIVPLGLELAPFLATDEAQAAAIRAAHAGPLVLFVGRFRYYKGLRYLVDAMRNVPGTLLLVGTGPDEQPLRRQVQQQGLGEQVVFAGAVSDRALPAYYHACDVFVLPACERSEAFGLVQVEAMASGRPVISTELGTGTSWVNQHGETGLVVPARDSAALAGALKSLLADDESRRSMGERARERALRLFTAERMAAGVAQTYREVVQTCKQR